MELIRIFNMIWTIGFNSGLKTGAEISRGELEATKEDIDRRASELLKEDAEQVTALLRLEKEMGEEKEKS